MTYTYTLIVEEETTGEKIAEVVGKSIESIQEQLGKVEGKQIAFEEEQKDLALDQMCEPEENN